MQPTYCNLYKLAIQPQTVNICLRLIRSRPWEFNRIPSGWHWIASSQFSGCTKRGGKLTQQGNENGKTPGQEIMRTTSAWRRETRLQRAVQILKCQNMKTVQRKKRVHPLCAMSQGGAWLEKLRAFTSGGKSTRTHRLRVKGWKAENKGKNGGKKERKEGKKGGRVERRQHGDMEQNKLHKPCG